MIDSGAFIQPDHRHGIVMPGRPIADVLKLWLYAVVTVWLGTWISPLVYNAGKAVEEVGSVKQTNAVFKWLARLCDRADFPVFFQTSLLITALVLFIPFVDWIRGGRFAKDGKIRRLLVPDPLPDAGGVRKNPEGIRQAAIGFCIIAGTWLLMIGLLLWVGLLTRNPLPPHLPRWLVTTLASALVMAAFQEILFRGIALGIFLRAMPAGLAIGLSALLFASVHFLQSLAGMGVADPELPGVGFELLGKIAGQLVLPLPVIGTLIPLLVLGGLLGWARWRTGSLLLPIGLHAGWWFAGSLTTRFTTLSSPTRGSAWLISPDSPQQGLIAFAALLATAGLIVRRHRHATDSPT